MSCPQTLQTRLSGATAPLLATWPLTILSEAALRRFCADRAAPVVKAAMKDISATMDTATELAEAQAMKLLDAGNVAGAQAVLNAHAISMGATATATWTSLWQKLTMLFVDGKVSRAGRVANLACCSLAAIERHRRRRATVV